MDPSEHNVGFFEAPQIIEVGRDNALAREEAFGPVFSIFKVQNEKEAVEVANETLYGLGGTVIGQDVERAEKVAR